jgi:hypothetical protein
MVGDQLARRRDINSSSGTHVLNAVLAARRRAISTGPKNFRIPPAAPVVRMPRKGGSSPCGPDLHVEVKLQPP